MLKDNMNGKICLVTGATNGISKATAQAQAVLPLIARSPEKGAETSIYLASSPKVQSITGKYFVDCKVTQPAQQATDMVVAKKLWDVSAEMELKMANPDRYWRIEIK